MQFVSDSRISIIIRNWDKIIDLGSRCVGYTDFYTAALYPMCAELAN